MADKKLPRGTLEILEFDPSRMMPAAGSLPISFDAGTRLDILSHLRLRYRTATSVVAALAVVALHALALLPAIWGGSATADPNRFGTPSAIHATLIDDRSAHAITPPALSAPLLRSVSVNLPQMPDRRDADFGLAALYGRYLGQIHARINRAWLKPRTAIGANLFRCEVEIWQRRDGVVQRVTLEHCNGSLRWQQSLVQGIEAASPLPGPPDPAVFAERVVLHFRALAFAPGEPAGEYEPVAPALPSDDQAYAALAQSRSLHRPGTEPRAPVAIELRIRGSHVQVESLTKSSREHP